MFDRVKNSHLTLQNFGLRRESSYCVPMRDAIERLRREPQLESIVRRFPHAVKTPEGIVIPCFDRVSDDATIEACVTPHAVALRPHIRSEKSWESVRDAAIRHLERALDVSFRDANTDVTLEEEWGDFTVWCR